MHAGLGIFTDTRTNLLLISEASGEPKTTYAYGKIQKTLKMLGNTLFRLSFSYFQPTGPLLARAMIDRVCTPYDTNQIAFKV